MRGDKNRGVLSPFRDQSPEMRNRMFWIMTIVATIAMIPIGIYMYHFLKRMAECFGLCADKVYTRIFLVIFSIGLIVWASNIWGVGAVIILHLFLSALLVQLIHFILNHLCFRRKKVIDKVYCCGLIPILITMLIMGYGYWNMGHVRKTEYVVQTEKKIRPEGYRIAMISDLHYGTTMNQEKLAAYCHEIGQQNPDFIVLCGDIVDENTTYVQLQEVMQELGSIQNTYGVFYVYGNHDLSKYSSHPGYKEEQFVQVMQEAGIQILADNHVQIHGELTIVGRNDWSYQWGGVHVRMDAEKLLRDVSKKDFVLLLDHQPRELEQNDKAGYDLQLSGHTHAGQIWPVGIISGLLGFGELNYGYQQMSHLQVIVSSGMAGWGYPVRTGSHSEYVMVTVEQK